MSVDLTKLREHEDEVKRVIDSWPLLKRLIAYAYIRRADGISMEQIDYKILEEAKKEIKEGRF